jgi:hypothetical protein
MWKKSIITHTIVTDKIMIPISRSSFILTNDQVTIGKVINLPTGNMCCWSSSFIEALPIQDILKDHMLGLFETCKFNIGIPNIPISKLFGSWK